MNLSNQTKLLMLVAAILIFILFLNNFYNQEPMKNEGALTMDNNNNDITVNTNNIASDNEYKYLEDVVYNEIPKNDLVISDENIQQGIDYANYNCTSDNCVEQNYRKKVRGKNKATNGEYKKSSYSGGKRGNGPSEFDAFFDKNNEMVKDVYAGNDTFTGNDETGGNLAMYKPGRKVKMTDEEMFNANNLLPQEQKEDWFEVMPEPISVKNKHLINLSRPIGINTIGTTNKNPTYDLRGTIPNPKSVVSPWMQSSIEPDINNRGLSGC